MIRQILNSLDQFSVSAGQHNATLGHNMLVNNETVEILLLAFLEFLLFWFLDLAIFVVLDGAVQEAMLGIFESARVAIQNVTTVAAGIFG